jgi:hypothetical protein
MECKEETAVCKSNGIISFYSEILKHQNSHIHFIFTQQLNIILTRFLKRYFRIILTVCRYISHVCFDGPTLSDCFHYVNAFQYQDYFNKMIFTSSFIYIKPILNF